MNHELKELVLCFTACKDTSTENTDEKWKIRVNRGGLCYVKNTTYILFVAIEEVRQSLKRLLMHWQTVVVKAVVESKVVYWLIAQAGGDDDVYQLLY